MTQTKAMPFILRALPYAQNALEPVISANTVNYHYGKHHKAYVDKLNALVAGTEYEGLKLEELILKTAGQADKAAVFNNAAQVWNHDLYWDSLTPEGGGKPSGDMGRKIGESFGDYENFLLQFVEAGVSNFGSGWVWLVEDKGALKITQTHNAENPLSQNQPTALLVLDVWEHAYYLDYQHRRGDHLKEALGKLINWRTAEMNSLTHSVLTKE